MQRFSWFALVLTVASASCTNEKPPAQGLFHELGFAADLEDEVETLEQDLQFELDASQRAAACMREQGFDYTPWVSGSEVVAVFARGPRPGTAEFAASLGYGVLSTFPERLATHPAAKQDPNSVAVDGLSSEGRAVYLQSLYGADAGLGDARPGVDADLYAQGGCFGRETRDQAERGNLVGTLLLSYRDVEDRANADRRMVAYDRAWSRCMSERGFGYESSASARHHFMAVADELWVSARFPADGYSPDQLAELTDEERTELYSGRAMFDEARWESETERERLTATADLLCQGEQQRSELFSEIIRQFESDFEHEHHSMIDAVRALEE